MDRRIIVGLDIGTTKIGVVVGEVLESGDTKIVGIGTSPSEGLRKGVVVNIDKTVISINKAIEEAELMAGIDVKEVYVGIAGRHIKSLDSRGMIAVARTDNEITPDDVRRVIDQASTIAIPADREVIHVIPQGFVVDEQTGIKDPIGMSGVKLEGDVHIVTGALTSAQNIYKSVEKAGIKVVDIVLEPLASAYAVLDKDERELGVAVIDMGGGTTDIAIFIDDAIRYTSSIDFGGTNVTSDLAIGIRTPVDRAEEIKKKSGTCVVSQMDNDNFVIVPGVGGRPNKEISRAFLANIIRSRMAEIFSMVAKDIVRTRLKDKLGAGIVLTGGGSLMEGAIELAEEVFGMPVKLGTPKSLGGLSNAVATPIHATGVGLVLYGMQRLSQERIESKSNRKGEGVMDLFKKFSVWVKNYI
jgi:cell division protein FtsA